MSLEQTNLELLSNNELIETIGGNTSITYDLATLTRMSFQTVGGDFGGAVTTVSNWWSYQ